MKCVKKIAMSEPLVDLAEKELVMSDICTILELDLYTVTIRDLTFANQYRLKMSRDDTVHAVVCWFDSYFSRLENPKILTTSIYSTPTHWQQTVFYLSTPIKMRKGEELTGSIGVTRSQTNFRDLDIKLSFHKTSGGKEESGYVQMYKLR